MNDVNNILIRREQYKDDAEFKNAVRDTVMLLLEAGYIITTRYEEPGLGFISIYFEMDDISLCGLYPYWLTPEQYESIDWGEEQ